jgi:hypothetical protein
MTRRRDLQIFVTIGIIFWMLIIWTVVAHAQTRPPWDATLSPTHHVRYGWYNRITPKQGGPSCLVGPWFTRAAAADWQGSALYSHSFQCHLDGVTCQNIGNGYAYPKGLPYPPPYQIPASGPELLPIAGNPHWHGATVQLYYGNDGSCTVFPIKDLPKYKAMLGSGVGQGVIPYYANSLCPGWPGLYVGDRPDAVCN